MLKQVSCKRLFPFEVTTALELNDMYSVKGGSEHNFENLHKTIFYMNSQDIERKS